MKEVVEVGLSTSSFPIVTVSLRAWGHPKPGVHGQLVTAWLDIPQIKKHLGITLHRLVIRASGDSMMHFSARNMHMRDC